MDLRTEIIVRSFLKPPMKNATFLFLSILASVILDHAESGHLLKNISIYISGSRSQMMIT